MIINFKKQWILYFVCCILTITFSVYFFFPSNTVKEYIRFHFNKAFPDYKVSIDKVKPAFPPGLSLHNVGFYYSKYLMLEAERIKIYPKLLSVFGQTPTFVFKGATCAGLIEGTIDLTKGPPVSLVIMDANLKDIQIKDIHALQNAAPYQISGKLGGKVLYSQKMGNFETVSATLGLSDCKIDLSSKVLGLGEITFSMIEADITADNYEILLKRCILKGHPFDCELAGTAKLMSPFYNSSLDFNGSFMINRSSLTKPGKNFSTILLLATKTNANGIFFRIEGTLGKPWFSLRQH